jgi:hypothetical protein
MSGALSHQPDITPPCAGPGGYLNPLPQFPTMPFRTILRVGSAATSRRRVAARNGYMRARPDPESRIVIRVAVTLRHGSRACSQDSEPSWSQCRLPCVFAQVKMSLRTVSVAVRAPGRENARAAAYGEADAQAARAELGERAIELPEEAGHLPLQAEATGSVPPVYDYLLQKAKSAARADVDRGR